MPMPQTSDLQPPDTRINSQDGRQYWENAQADNDGMLGGIPALKSFSHISRTDILGSRAFLARLGIGAKGSRATVANALEGGAGIGRVTEGLLLNIAEQVDVVEPIVRFTETLQGKSGVRRIYNLGLEDWQPDEGITYDLVWTQWCLGHLTDQQIIDYLTACKGALRQDTGLIVVKENLSTGAEDVFDEADSSVTRLDQTFRSLFQRAGLKLVRTELQRTTPVTASSPRLLPVRMYALKPQ